MWELGHEQTPTLYEKDLEQELIYHLQFLKLITYKIHHALTNEKIKISR